MSHYKSPVIKSCGQCCSCYSNGLQASGEKEYYCDRTGTAVNLLNMFPDNCPLSDAPDTKEEKILQSGEAPHQQLKAAIILLDKLLAWDNGDTPGSVNMVDVVISEWRKIKAAV